MRYFYTNLVGLQETFFEDNKEQSNQVLVAESMNHLRGSLQFLPMNSMQLSVD